MMRPHVIWIAFLFCLGVVTAALGWISHTVLRLENAEVQAARQSENERLALWRMDSTMMPLITRESARPAYEYQPFYVPNGLYTWDFSPIDASRLQSRSSLLTLDTPLIRLHFQYDSDGNLTSPQVPTQSWRDFSEHKQFTTFEKIEEYSQELQQLQAKLSWDDLNTMVAREIDAESDADNDLALIPPNPAPEIPPEEMLDRVNVFQQQLAQPFQQSAERNNSRSLKEFERRKGAAQKDQVRGAPYPQAPNAAPEPEPNAEMQPGQVKDGLVEESQPNPSFHGPMQTLWHDGLLILARRTLVDGRESIQGCLLDWIVIRRRLLGEITDLLPDANLVPTFKTPRENDTLLLATLPVWLSPGSAPLEALPEMTPIRLSIFIAWGGVFLAALAVAILLMCVVRLSERRGAFVSAVTHELRTPLTTFRLYTEMLADNIVPDEHKRQHYLQTLRVEADRLGHLVENVLSYARLENGRSLKVKDEIDLAELLTRLDRPLRERAERSGMTLDVDLGDEQNAIVFGDGAAIERIVFNLVDNACKYAKEADNRAIHIVCRHENGTVFLEVRDHGKGIEKRSNRRMFRPFSKTATEAAHSAPGVGLGLALCRRLAKSLGGKLEINHHVAEGACLVLTLPQAPVKSSEVPDAF